MHLTALFIIFVILSEAKDLCTCHAEGLHAERMYALKQPSSSLSFRAGFSPEESALRLFEDRITPKAYSFS